jgi:glycoprotein endo-alpha-1,2-mannosidase
LCSQVCKKTDPGISRRRFLEQSGRHLAGIGASSVLLSSCGGGGGPTTPDPPVDRRALLVGAHYYLWFPENFAGGRYLRARLLPNQQPVLGEYSSASAAIAEQHIAWASSAGIDFFTLDWWPGLTERNARIDQSILAAQNLDQIRFCIFYELGGLGYDPRTGLTFFDGPTVERFLADQEQIARRYFTHPRYLRVGTRPVIIYYITRSASGRFEEAMARYRERMATLGFDPYVIGDELFWIVAKDDGSGFTAEPQRLRISLLDALTAYNLYYATEPNHSGYGATSDLLADAHALYALYRAAAGGKPVIPLAFPGYNDRGVRPEADHYPIPREWSPGAGEGTFLAEWMRRFTLPNLDQALPMVLVTSWNEWGEDTAIEPLAVAPPTDADVSASSEHFTQGFRYSGYGTTYLEVLRGLLEDAVRARSGLPPAGS